MEEMTLQTAVEKFASLTYRLTDLDLEKPWTWKDYEEGIRFAFFRTYEELRQLASNLATVRAATAYDMTTAQQALAQYHAAYRDLQAVLFGVSDSEAAQIPAENEWPLFEIVAHIAQAEHGFLGITAYALERARARDDRPLEMPDEAWEAFWEGDVFGQVKGTGALSGLMAYYQGLHQRVLDTLATISEDELSVASVFWEDTPMPVQFRLHRFDSHLRQHTVQVEKTLDMLGLHPNEAMRLLRLIYNALAEVEGILIGNDEIDTASLFAAAAEIAKRTDEISTIVAGV